MAVKKFPDLFAFDLDGTLVHGLSDGTRGIPDYLLERVHDLSKRAHVIVATGRRYRSAFPDIRTMPKMPFSVLNNGLVIKDSRGGTLECKAMSPKKAYEIGRMLEKRDIEFFWAADGYRERVDFIFLRETLENSAPLQSVYERTQGVNRVLNSLEDILKFRAAPLIEIATVAPHLRLLDIQRSIKGLLPKRFRAMVIKNIGYSQYGVLEIMPVACSKWTGVERVRKLLRARRIIAVGDDENDIEMIRSAHIGLVMDHAEPHVKKASKKHLAGPKGLAEFLKEFYPL